MWTPPLRPLTRETSLGFEAIEHSDWIHERIVQVAAERDEPELLELAPKLIEWQRWLFIHALELLPGPDLIFRFRVVLLLVARQNGKTTWLVYLMLWALFSDGARKVIGSAQTLDVAEETWETVVAIAEAIPELDEDVKKVTWGSGKRSLTLDANEKYQVVPSTRGGGRSKSGDLVAMDELREHTSWDAWAAVSKTTLARARAQLYGISNAGDAGSIVLRSLRAVAHSVLGDPDGLNRTDLGEEDVDGETSAPPMPDENSIGIFEWSAKPGLPKGDRDGWAQANPSMNYTELTERAIASAMVTDPDYVFRTEVLCQWSDSKADSIFADPKSGVDRWSAPAQMIVDDELVDDPDGGCLDDTSKRWKKSRVAVGIDTSWDRSITYVAIAAFRKDGLIHTELIARRAGTDWAIPYVEERVKRLGITAVAFQSNGAPVSSLVDEAEKADIPFVPWAGTELGRWTGLFFDRVMARSLRHLTQPALNLAAMNAATRAAGDAWMFDRKNSPVDIAGLVAVVAAVGALLNEDPPFKSAYADDDMELMIL